MSKRHPADPDIVDPQAMARTVEAVTLLARVKRQLNLPLYLDVRTDDKEHLYCAVYNKGSEWSIKTCAAVCRVLGLRDLQVTSSRGGLRIYLGFTVLGTRVRIRANCCQNGGKPVMALVPVKDRMVIACENVAREKGWSIVNGGGDDRATSG